MMALMTARYLLSVGWLATAVTFAAAPSLASAAQTTNIDDICDVIALVNLVAFWFGIVVFIVSVMAFLYAAFLFFTNWGNEEVIKNAKLVLLWATIGTAVALLATQADNIVMATVGGEQHTIEECRARL